MTESILYTKLTIPPLRAKRVQRSRLIDRLNGGLHRKLTLVAASAGCGKTTLVSEWLSVGPRPAAWLSLDAGDNDPERFMTYLCAALGTVGADWGARMPGRIPAQPFQPEPMMTFIINEICAIRDPFVLVLDDYHVIESRPIREAVALLLERMPPQMHLVIASREEPELPIARLRVRDQITEARIADLRFTSSEASEFLREVMDLRLSEEDVSVLYFQTEGWIAGLQLAALSMQGQEDASSFVPSFHGSHRYVLDYLVDEVLRQQPADIQAFLLRTSILDRFCGPLCDALLYRHKDRMTVESAPSGQEILETLERANLFIVPLDHERRWYRYHHLFSELLQQRLRQSMNDSRKELEGIAELHVRASEWLEDQGLDLEAFRHAAAAHDLDRAGRLLEGNGMPLLFRGAVLPIVQWLDSLPGEEADARPTLGIMHASALLMVGRISGVEPRLQAAEKALRSSRQDDKARDLIGHIASIRATLAVSRHEADTIMSESLRALEYLHPDNLPVRTATTWALGYAYELQGDRAAAGKAYADALSESRKIGHLMITIMAMLGQGNMQRADNRLAAAADTYRGVLDLAGDPPLPAACEAHLGLARINYEWNDLGAAEHHAQFAVKLARQFEHLDRVVAAEVFLARLKLVKGDFGTASLLLSETEHSARERHFLNQIAGIAEVQALALLRQGNLAAAAELAQNHGLGIIQARVLLEKGKPSAAIEILNSLRGQADDKGWEDERIRIMVLQLLALDAHGLQAKARQLLFDVLGIAQSGGFIRTFLDEGKLMERLLRDAAAHGRMPEYLNRLLDAFAIQEAIDQGRDRNEHLAEIPPVPLIEALSDRELEILRLIAQGLSNQDISERLYLALSTVKGHNRNIFDKLQVKRRTEAVAHARKLGLL